MPGVFSWRGLDEGTRTLLEAVRFAAGERALDLGCGYGVIGLLAARAGCETLLTDDNLLAVGCAAAGIAANELSNAKARAADVFVGLEGETFDVIYSNPPFHQQFETTTTIASRLVQGAKAALRPGGRLVMVGNTHLAYEKLVAAHLRTRVLFKDAHYTVIEGKV
jgi:16S rRNA (guanine1207-N2)-methyltransferase